MRRFGLWTVAAFLALIASVSTASALSCAATIGDLNFGSVNLTTGSVFDTSAAFHVNCSGGVALQNIRICPSIGQGSGGAASGGSTRYMTGTPAGQLNYNLFQDSGRSVIWGTIDGSMGSAAPPDITIALDAQGDGTYDSTIFGRIAATQQSVPAGTFQSTFASGNVSVASDLAIASPTCAAVGVTNATTASFNVGATYPASCTVSSATLNFGSIASTGTAVNSAVSINVNCSNSTPYTVATNDGLAGTNNPAARQMQHGTDRLVYGLYRDAGRTLVWGDTPGVDVLGGVGTGASVPVTVYGRVQQQTTPVVGTYNDTVVVTLSY